MSSAVGRDLGVPGALGPEPKTSHSAETPKWKQTRVASSRETDPLRSARRTDS